jgi:hypothetical protein
VNAGAALRTGGAGVAAIFLAVCAPGRPVLRVTATGTSGTDSAEIGSTWRPVGPGMNALSWWGLAGWAVGPKGRVARFVAKRTGGP